jgi:hypothetical protein
VVAAAAAGDRRSWAPIAAVRALAAGTGADVAAVGVGVESTAQLAQLRAVGVTYAQGYALSRPQSATQVRANLRRHGPTSWTLPEPAASGTAGSFCSAGPPWGTITPRGGRCRRHEGWST